MKHFMRSFSIPRVLLIDDGTENCNNCLLISYPVTSVFHLTLDIPCLSETTFIHDVHWVFSSSSVINKQHCKNIFFQIISRKSNIRREPFQGRLILQAQYISCLPWFNVLFPSIYKAKFHAEKTELKMHKGALFSHLLADNLFQKTHFLVCNRYYIKFLVANVEEETLNGERERKTYCKQPLSCTLIA